MKPSTEKYTQRGRHAAVQLHGRRQDCCGCPAERVDGKCESQRRAEGCDGADEEAPLQRRLLRAADRRGEFSMVFQGKFRANDFAVKMMNEQVQHGHDRRVHQGGRNTGQVPVRPDRQLLPCLHNPKPRHDGDGVRAVRVADGLHQEAGGARGARQGEGDPRRGKGP